MTTKPSSTPLEQEVAEMILGLNPQGSYKYVTPGEAQGTATQILQLIKGKLPKEPELPRVEDTTYGYKFGYRQAIKEVHKLVGGEE